MSYYITTKSAVTPFALLGTGPNRTEARELAKKLGGTVRTEAEYNELLEKATLEARLATSLEAAYPALEDAIVTNEEVQESGDLEDRLEAALNLADAEKRVVGEFTHCPHCGVDLRNGHQTYENLMADGDKLAHGMTHEYMCLGCGETFGPEISRKEAPKTTMAKVDHSNKSTTGRPCKLVWAIADEMFSENPNTRRKEVLAACVNRGVAFYTARTQYQQWLSVQKEMAEREAAQAK